MHRILPIICAATIGVTSLATGAASMPRVAATQVQSDVVGVQYRARQMRGQGDRFSGRQTRRGEVRRGYSQRGGAHFYNGHRGYRQQRPGYRRHNGFWFPPAAFIAGVIIGGTIAQPAPTYRAPVRTGSAHVAWCQNRYVSYRVADNSFQPYNGPRRACVSPYG